jgi:hypothetical protein
MRGYGLTVWCASTPPVRSDTHLKPPSLAGGSSDSDDKVARSDYANACGMHESNWEPLEWALNKEGVESEAEEELEWQLEHIRSGILLNSISVGESSLRDKHARIAKRRGKAERREERAALLEKYAAEMRKVVAAGSLDAPAAAAAAAAAPLEIVADDEGMMLKVLRLSEAFSLAASVKGTTVCLSYSRGHSRLPSPSEHACLLRALGGHASAQLPRSTRGRSCRRTHGGGGASDQKCGESSHRGLKRDDSSETERCRGRGRKRRFPVAFTSGGHMVPHSARKDVAADPEDGVHRGREEEGAGIGTGSEEVEGRQAGDEEVEGRRTGKGDGGEDQCMLRLQTYASTSKARVHERKRRLRTAEQGDVLGRQEEGQEEGVDPVVYGHFATRLMAKMGYKQGEGLGVRSDGIRAPIAVSKRPRKLGLGVHV